MLSYFNDHPAILWSVTGVSGALILAAIIATPICLVRLPRDYFSNHEKYERTAKGGTTRKLAKNFAGIFLILSGLAMLLLPGQGLITVLLGVMITDIPGKQRLIAWTFSRKGVLKGVNWLRRKLHKPPMSEPRPDGRSCARRDADVPSTRPARVPTLP